jgi:hypothetical protein
MWTPNQLSRLALEHQLLQVQGFTQFSVYHHTTTDTYSASGTTSSNAGYKYHLYIPIPAGFPTQRPPMYVTEPCPLLMSDRVPINTLGVSHRMHALTPHACGWVQICHWRDSRWHSGIYLHQVFLKGLIWIEAYEQHVSTGRDLADFVRTMAETA